MGNLADAAEFGYRSLRAWLEANPDHPDAIAFHRIVDDLRDIERDMFDED